MILSLRNTPDGLVSEGKVMFVVTMRH